MNIVTKSGTNDCPRQLLRDVPRQVDERARRTPRRRNNVEQAGLPAQPVRRQLRRTDRQGQARITSPRSSGRSRTPSRRSPRKGLFPSLDGIYADAVPRDPVHVKATANINAGALPVGPLRPKPELAALRRDAADDAPNNWGDSKNQFNSINVNHNWVIGGSEAERVHLPVRRLRQPHHRAAATTPPDRSRTASTIGQNPNTPQTTAAEEVAVPRRLLVAPHRQGRRRPRLEGRRELHQRAAPVHHVQHGQGRRAAHPPDRRRRTDRSRASRCNDGDAAANIPLKQYAFYIQDDWRVSDRLTLNLGLRYDLIRASSSTSRRTPTS